MKRSLPRLLTMLAAATVCTGCMLVAYSLPEDAYEMQAPLMQLNSSSATGLVRFPWSADTGQRIQVHVIGAEPGARYGIRVRSGINPGCDKALSKSAPFPSAPNGHEYMGGLSTLVADSHGDIDQSGRVAGAPMSGLLTFLVKLDPALPEGESFVACGLITNVKVKEGWGHPKM